MTTVVLLLIAGVLVVAGTSVGITLAVTSGGEPQASAGYRPVPSSRPSTPIPSPTPKVKTNSRQNIEAKIGETVSFGDANSGAAQVSFAITKITIDGRCTGEYAEKSENGHFIFVDLSVTTSSAMNRDYGSLVVNAMGYSIIGPDGITETGGALMTTAAGMCQPLSKRVPLELSPGQKYVGTLVFDSRNNSGALVLTPGLRVLDASGWEWQIGAKG